MNNNQTSPIKIRQMVADADRNETTPDIIFVVLGALFSSFLLLGIIYFIFKLDIWLPILKIIVGIAFVILIQKSFGLFGEKIKSNLFQDYRDPNSKAYETYYK